MTFRFKITEAHLARKPIVVLIGNILEGEIWVGDRLVVPLCEGTEFVGTVEGILHTYDTQTYKHDTQMYDYASIKEGLDLIGIGVWRSDCHEVRDIFCGLATKVQS